MKNYIGVNNSNENNISQNEVVLDLLYLDLSVCTRCQDTETSIDDSLNDVLDLLKNIGKKIKLNKIHIETEKQAIEHQFLSSPTIRVNGRDIQMEVKENYCSACSSLTDDASVNCRLWLYNGKEYTAPPKQMIIDEIMKELYSVNKSSSLEQEEPYILPNNLKEYFSQKDKLCANVSTDKNGCCESNECCS